MIMASEGIINRSLGDIERSGERDPVMPQLKGSRSAMRDEHKPIVILLADDDEEDRMLACDALVESRLSNETHCVVDGEDLNGLSASRG